MSAITIRNLPEGVHDGLRAQAAAANLSVEALVRNLLAAATRHSAPAVTGMADAGTPWGHAAGPGEAASPPELWGALRGCVQVQAATDLTAPLDEAWDAAS